MGAPRGNCNAAKNKSACRYRKRSVSAGAKNFLKRRRYLVERRRHYDETIGKDRRFRLGFNVSTYRPPSKAELDRMFPLSR